MFKTHRVFPKSVYGEPRNYRRQEHASLKCAELNTIKILLSTTICQEHARFKSAEFSKATTVLFFCLTVCSGDRSHYVYMSCFQLVLGIGPTTDPTLADRICSSFINYCSSFIRCWSSTIHCWAPVCLVFCFLANVLCRLVVWSLFFSVKYTKDYFSDVRNRLCTHILYALSSPQG